ncbi:MAG: toll/interleukin-1 receptor domain-containing protein [Verrucomicrobiae bacterium]|nr:toll/interleukin-1 receptor domain-containing protein [Verrucomicrobiae bacterium]
MYRAFLLEHFQWPTHWVSEGKAIQQNLVQEARESFSAFEKNKAIDATFLRDQWFPEVDTEVFISHSHTDEDIALNLAGFLKSELKLDSFIDSCVWGHSNDLLRNLDDDCCWQEESKTYNYNLRNGTTSHVHMMLSTAISRMLDKCECVIFVSSPNSVSTSQGLDSAVSSPWIFYELSQIQILRKRKPEAHRRIFKEAKADFSVRKELPPFRYSVDFSSLTQIDSDDLEQWATEFSESLPGHKHPLDILYEMLSKA